MMKKTILFIVLFAVFCGIFGWLQTRILEEREGKRIEEKILMLSNRPAVTKTLSLGFDNAVADILWIRAIQYFGGNFSTLDVEEKRNGMLNLMNNLVGLDPHFIAAYKFGGFVINESIKEPETAMNFLIDGAENNPKNWQLPFDAGFIAFYQLQQHELAKDLFIRATYGTAYSDVAVEETQGLVSASEAEALLDGDPYTGAGFETGDGMFVLSLGGKKPVGRIAVEEQSGFDQSYLLQYLSRSVDTYIDKETTDISGVATHSFDPAVQTEKLKFSQFSTSSPSGIFTLHDIKVYGARNPETPSYVERMIFEMDRASGRFLAAWEQYLRYYNEAVEKGDTVSANIALTKLDDIYTSECIKLIEEAALKYIDDHDGQLPSPTMSELVEQGYLQQVIEEKKAENPQFESEVLRVLIPPGGSLWDILTDMNGEHPHLLLPSTEEDAELDWYLASRKTLLEDREARINAIQPFVEQYKIEYGQYPESLTDLLDETWFQSTEDIFVDPFGGEFYIDQETGEIRVRNAKY